MSSTNHSPAAGNQEESRTRRRPLIDTPVQGALLLQTILHWTMLTAAATTILFIWQVLLGRPEATLQEHLGDMWVRYAPFYTVIICLIPVVIYDSLRLTNRLAGPVHKLRRSLAELADGKEVTPISFRKKDFWPDLADNFNSVAGQLAETRSVEPQGNSTEAELQAVGEHV